MAPESNTSQNPQRTVPSGQTVSVPAPADGADVTVASSPGGELDLGFDPGTATATRSDNSLVFELDSGGTVTITDFFAVGDESLPNLKLPDGTVVASTDFFEGSDLDLTTAAGPGAGAAPGGGTNYSDDPGSLIAGLDKYGMLGTDYWGRETEIGEEVETLTYPSGGFSFGVSTGDPDDPSQNFRFILGAYEDGMPRQHLESLVEGHPTDGRTFAPARINFYPEPGPETAVGEILFWGLPEGTVLYQADPGSPTGYAEITPNAAGVYVFTEADFVDPGVFLVPPANSDNDFTFQASVELVAPGGDIVLPGIVDVIVDAVADKPDLAEAEFDDFASTDGFMAVNENSDDQTLVDGWAKDDIHKGDAVVPEQNPETTVKFRTTITFGDYDPADDSERHYALVEVPGKGEWTPEVTSPADIACTGIVTVWYGADGSVIGETARGGEAPAGAASSTDFYQFQVPNEYLNGTQGQVDLEITFTTTEQFTHDWETELEAAGKAVEENLGGQDLDYDNNVSYTFASDVNDGQKPVLRVDTIDSRLAVDVGWASEDNDPGQHLADPNSYKRDFEGMYDPGEGNALNQATGIDENSTHTYGFGAPITISISGGDAKFSNTETITEIRLYFAAAAGDILVNGNALTILYDSDKRPYVELTTETDGGIGVIDGNGNYDYTTTSGVTFRPHAGTHSDEDVDLWYEVDVVAQPSGASATYTGKTTVVIDAVADYTELDASMNTERGVLVEIGPEGSGDYVRIEAEGTVTVGRDGTSGSDLTDPAGKGPDATTGWETDTYVNRYESATYPVNVRVEAHFQDTDGSEEHYILVQVPNGAWSIDVSNLPQDFEWQDTADYYYTAADGTVYFKIDVTDATTSGDTWSADDGKLDVEIPLLANVTVGADGSLNEIAVDIKTGTFVEETTGRDALPGADNMEYDTGNNIAVNIGNSGVTYKIDVINSTLTVKTGWASEGNSDAKHLGSADGTGYSTADESGPGPNGSISEDAGAPVRIAISGGTDPNGAENEFISKVTVSADAFRGEFYLGGQSVSDILSGSGEVVVNGVTYTVSEEDGVIVIEVGSGSMTDLGDLIVFRPVSDPADPNYYNDADVAVTYTVRVENGSGARAEFGDTSTIVIDAVADRSSAVDSSITVGHDSGGLEVGDGRFGPVIEAKADEEDGTKDGWITHTFDADGIGREYGLTVKVETTFSDLDHSEKHYVLIQDNSVKDGPQWSVNLEALNKAYPGYDFTAADVVSYIDSDDKTYFALDVSRMTQAGGSGGKVSIEVPLTVTDVEKDLTDVTIKTGSLAEEQDGSTIQGVTDNKLGGMEYDVNNNLAERLDGNELKYDINVINSSLTVKAGWASESNNDAKYLGKESQHYEYNEANAVGSGAMTQEEWDERWDADPDAAKLGSVYNESIDMGAPITIAIDENNGEHISSVKLILGKGYSAAGGVIYDASGVAVGSLFYGATALGPVEDPENPGTFSFTMEVYGNATSVDLLFVPDKQGFNQNDIPLKYEVKITDNTDPSITATAKGETTIVIDAVADLGSVSTVPATYPVDDATGWQQTAAKPDEDVTLKGTVTFPDTTEDNETHTIRIEPVENASGGSAAITMVTISGGGETLYFKLVGTDLVECDASGNILASGMTVSPAADGSYSFEVDETVGSWDVEITASGAAVHDSHGNAQDATYQVDLYAVSDVNVADGEYDTLNNHAETKSTASFDVAPNNTGTMSDVKPVGTYESTDGTWSGVDPNAHGTTATIRDGADTHTPKTVNVTLNAQGNITFDVSGNNQGGGSVEAIYKVSMTVEGDFTSLPEDGAQGSFWVRSGNTWVQIDPASTDDAFTFELDAGNTVITYTAPNANSQATTIKYVGASHEDKDLTILDAEVTLVNSKSFEQSTVSPGNLAGDKSIELVVDEVANLPGTTDVSSDTSADAPASGGQMVTATATVTFADTDGSEEHSILVQDLSAAGFSYAGCTVTVDGTSYAIADLETITITRNGRTETYFKVPVANDDPSIDVTVEMITPTEYGSGLSLNGSGGGHTYNPKIGGMAVENNPDGTLTSDNNAAVSVQETPVHVDLIDSAISVGADFTYENGRPNGHVFQSRDDVKAMDGTGKESDDAADVVKVFNPGDLSGDGKVIDTVAELKAVGAAITVSQTFTHGVADGNEVISRATFLVNAGSEPTSAPNQFMYKGVLINVLGSGTIDGDAYACELLDNGTAAEPNWVVKVTIEDFDATQNGDSSLYFIPGENHDSGELALDYAITVKDETTGQEKIFASDAGLRQEALDAAKEAAGTDGPTPLDQGNLDAAPEIIVDSVAEAAEIINVEQHAGIGDAQYVESGGLAEVDMTITIGDGADGSEQHFVFVEEISGWTVDSITIGDGDYDASELTIVRQTLDLGDGEARAYWKIMLPEAAVIEGGDKAEHNVKVYIQTDGSSTSETIHTGTGSQENYLPGSQRPVGDTEEETWDNNTSFRPGDAVKVEFDQGSAKPGLSVPKGYYEHGEGDPVNEFAEGRCVAISLTGAGESDGNTVTSITITETGQADGTLYFFADDADRDAFMQAYNDALKSGNPPKPGDYGATPVTSGTAITGSDLNGGGFAFVPKADSNLDDDYSFTYEIGYTKGSTGASHTVGGSGYLIGDAVAQFPHERAFDGLFDSEGNAADWNFGWNSFDKDGNNPALVYTTTMTGHFEDVEDGSTEHFFLIEAEGNFGFEFEVGNDIWISVNGGGTYTDAEGAEHTLETYTHKDGTVYYMIPADPGSNGNASVDIRVIPPRYNPALADGPHDEDTRNGSISTGALSREVDEEVGRELDWNNNQAVTINDDPGLGYTIDGIPPGSDIEFYNLYEDNMPNAHEGDYTKTPGIMNVDPHSDADYVIITFPNGEAELGQMVDGVWTPVLVNDSMTMTNGCTVTNLGDGQYRVDNISGNSPNIPVMLTDSYKDSDKDFKVTYEYRQSNGTPVEGGGGTVEAVVDAVADRGDITAIAGDGTVVIADGKETDTIYSVDNAAGENRVTTVTVEAEFGDVLDESENRYILVEKTSDWTPGGVTYDDTYHDVTYDTYYHDGQAYYRIDVTEYCNGPDFTYKLDMKYTGDQSHYAEAVLDVRVMTEERNMGSPNGDMEIRTDNNVSVSDPSKAVVAWSIASSTLNVFVDDTEHSEYATALFNEDGITPYTGGTVYVKGPDGTRSPAGADDLGYKVTISVANDGNDILNDVTFDIPDGSYLFVNGHMVDPDKSIGKQLVALGLGSIDDLLSADVTYRPGQFEHHDQTLGWKATFTDSLSEDSADANGTSLIVIDAEANGIVEGEDVRDSSDVSGEWSAVKSGENAVVTVKADFIDASEELWVVLEQNIDYKLEGITVNNPDGTPMLNPATGKAYTLDDVVTKYDSRGETYYAVKVPGDATVEFEITTPDGYTGDGGKKLAAGTITTVPDADKEFTLADNWKENIEPVEVKTGIVETGGVTFVMGALVENDSNGADIALSQASIAELAGNNEVLGNLTLTFTMNQATGPATIIYDGQSYEISFVNGRAEWSVPDGKAFDPGADLRIVWGTGEDSAFVPNHSGRGNITVRASGTIVDAGSGDEASFTGTAAGTIGFTPMPDGGDMPSTGTTEADAVKNPAAHTGSVQVEYTTAFVDTDGSENHYLVFEVPYNMSVDGASFLSTAELAGMNLPAGIYFRMAVTGDGPYKVTFTVEQGYTDGGKVKAYAVSEEKDNPGRYKVSDDYSEVTIDGPDSYNDAPTVTGTGASSGFSSITTSMTASVAVGSLFKDSENDAITLSGVKGGNDNERIDIAIGQVTARGAYGTLVISPDGTFKYTVNPGTTVPAGTKDVFTLWGRDSYRAEADGSNSLIISFANTVITGSADADTLNGTDASEVIYGMTGNDIINGGGGSDTIHAGDGNNLIRGGGSLNNKITSGSGDDTIHTGRGNDTVEAGNGANVIYVEDGFGNTRITTGSGDDYIKIDEGASGNSVINAGDGNNTVEVYGSGGNRITTGGNADSIDIHGDGNNAINLGAGDDTVYISGDGDNTLTFNSGLNLADLTSATGDNRITGGSQADTIRGGSGNDTFLAGAGDDIIFTGAGNNLVYGGIGSDQMHSGSGNNTFAWNSGDIANGATDQIVNFKYGHDILQFDGGSVDDYIKGVKFDSASKVTLTVQQGSAEQTIELNFTENDKAMSDMFNTYQEYQTQNNTEASDALLAHLITALTNNS